MAAFTREELEQFETEHLELITANMAECLGEGRAVFVIRNADKHKSDPAGRREGLIRFVLSWGEDEGDL